MFGGKSKPRRISARSGPAAGGGYVLRKTAKVKLRGTEGCARPRHGAAEPEYAALLCPLGPSLPRRVRRPQRRRAAVPRAPAEIRSVLRDQGAAEFVTQTDPHCIKVNIAN